MFTTYLDETPQINIRQLMKARLFKHRQPISIAWDGDMHINSVRIHASTFKFNSLIFKYELFDLYSGRFNPVVDEVVIVSTPSNLIGSIYWFLCPLCEKRIAILYHDDRGFVCRHCTGLKYESQCRNHRYKLEWALRDVDTSLKIAELERRTKRRTYNGKLTRNQKRIEKLQGLSMKNLKDAMEAL